MNKNPYTYLIFCLLLAVFIVLYAIGLYFDRPQGAFDVDNAGLGGLAIVLVPAIIAIVVLQFVLYIGLIKLVITGMRAWSTLAIMAAAAISPFLLIFDYIFAVIQLGNITGDKGTIDSLAWFYAFAAGIFVCGVIAYNDIKYRRPKQLLRQAVGE